MKALCRWIGLSAMTMALGFGAGCATVGSSPSGAADGSDQLAGEFAEARREQQRLDRELTKLRDELYANALELKGIRDRLESAAGASTANVARIVKLEEKYAEARGASARADAELGSLRASLEREQQHQQRLQAIVAEREKEVRDLRAAMQARQDAIGKSAPAPAKPAAPRTQEPPPAAKESTPVVSAAPSTNVYRLVADGQRALKAGDLKTAQQLFEAARAQQPTLAGAQLGLAAIAYQVDNLADALRLANEVLDADSRNAQALGLRGLVRWREGSTRDGVRDCGRAVELDPADPLLRKFYGITLNAQGRQQDAIREMRKAVELDPNDGESKLNLAILLATAPKPDLVEARLMYDQALAAGVSRDEALDKLLGIVTVR